ncbi:MAG: hypothetical protein JKY93_03370 [Gammaproteobacteria bacterium]|nr:hypothetical protein [Gammaproteobacteria bacterium]
MSRLLQDQPDPAAIQALLKKEDFKTTLCAEYQFDSGTLRFCDRIIDFSDIDGNVWTGAAGWVGVSEVSGGTDSLASYLTYTLGIPWENWDAIGQDVRATIPALVSNPAEYFDRHAILSTQMFDNQGAVVGSRIILDKGKMNRPTLSVKPGQISLSLTSENAFQRKRVPPFGYLTQGNQQHRHPTDNGLEYTPTTASRPVDWLNS